MSQNSDHSRSHDLFGALLGLGALAMLLVSPWQVDTTGPDPFYKGPLLFPLMILGMTLAASLPSMWRLIKPGVDASWHLDDFENIVTNPGIRISETMTAKGPEFSRYSSAISPLSANSISQMPLKALFMLFRTLCSSSTQSIFSRYLFMVL